MGNLKYGSSPLKIGDEGRFFLLGGFYVRIDMEVGHSGYVKTADSRGRTRQQQQQQQQQ